MVDTKPDALLPCPFCNSAARTHTDDGLTQSFTIFCICPARPRTQTHYTTPHEAITAWNTRAALSKPSVAPEDEALIDGLRAASYRHAQDCPLLPYDHRPEVTGAMEALRRHIAGLRAQVTKAQAAFVDENVIAVQNAVSVSRLERELSIEKAALAACRTELDALRTQQSQSALDREYSRTGISPV